jgi:DNA-binding CsgD family transcriptional regulator
MGGMGEEFNAPLEDAFRAADAARNKVEIFKKEERILRSLAREWPVGTAAWVVRDLYEALSRMMKLNRKRAAELYGTDIADPDWPRGFQKIDVLEAGKLLMLANMHLAYEECLRRLDACIRETALSEEELIVKACEVCVEALRAPDAVLLHNLHELHLHVSRNAPQEVVRFVRDAEAQQLASHLATRISITINRRLAKALDDIREHNKPARRERFESLLKELYALAPEAWSDHHVNDWQLETTRSVVLKMIEQPQTPHVEEAELAMFAHDEREALLKRGRDAGLPPSEYELLKVLAANPKIPNREAADKLGKSVGTVKKLKHNIKKTLGAA